MIFVSDTLTVLPSYTKLTQNHALKVACALINGKLFA